MEWKGLFYYMKAFAVGNGDNYGNEKKRSSEFLSFVVSIMIIAVIILLSSFTFKDGKIKDEVNNQLQKSDKEIKNHLKKSTEEINFHLQRNTKEIERNFRKTEEVLWLLKYNLDTHYHEGLKRRVLYDPHP